MANIGAREAAARNSYRTAVAQLAEQIQARYDTKKYYNDQLKLQNQALQSQYASQFVNDNKNTDSQQYLPAICLIIFILELLVTIRVTASAVLLVLFSKAP